MILGCWKCFEQVVGEGFSCWFPALFGGIEFGCIGRESYDLKSFVIFFKEGFDEFAFVAGAAVDEEEYAAPAC